MRPKRNRGGSLLRCATEDQNEREENEDDGKTKRQEAWPGVLQSSHGEMNCTPSREGTNDQENVSGNPIPAFDKTFPPFGLIRKLD